MSRNESGASGGQVIVPVKARSWFSRAMYPFNRALVRGLAVVMPPLLTIVLFIWAWKTIETYILLPVESFARNVIVWSINETIPDTEAQRMVAAGEAKFIQNADAPPSRLTRNDGQNFSAIRNEWLPAEVVEYVEKSPEGEAARTGRDYYQSYVRQRYLQRHLVLPALFALFIFVLYLVGKLLAAGVGKLLWISFERLINKIPLIRNVYSSVKQVTDFAFNPNEQAIKVTRIVAIQYPRIGIWSMGFLTNNDSMPVAVEVAGEPMVNVLMPTSPMPATGFTIMVPRSQTVDLNITVDQAIQFCVSCGVVSPTSVDPKTIESRIQAATASERPENTAG